MKKVSINQQSVSCYFILIAVMLIAWSGSATAYPKWQSAEGQSDYCSACHRQFDDANYFSFKDGAQWPSGLMDGHLEFVSGCDSCHRGSRDFGRVWLNESDSNARPKSCVGCHGRDEDVTGQCSGLSGDLDGLEVECGSGAGLRQHHFRRGQTFCADCHADSDPAIFSPAGEDAVPFNYGQNGVGPVDPCNADMTESQFGLTGLDNDGDSLDDNDDPDCSPAVDTDQDGVNDDLDNCTDVANAAQQDADGDGHGNICDADFDNNCFTTFPDLSAMQAGFFTADVELDLNSSGGPVNFADLAIMQDLFFLPPGPSAAGSLCNP